MSNKVQKLSEYTVCNWSEDQFVESFSTIIKSATFTIQEITTKKKDKVYLVPEEFYQAAMALICLVEEDDTKEASKG